MDTSNVTFNNETSDVVFMSFPVEIFDNPEIRQLLGKVWRVLEVKVRSGGTSLSRSKGNSLPIRIYEWIQRVTKIFR